LRARITPFKDTANWLSGNLVFDHPFPTRTGGSMLYDAGSFWRGA
jgi:hypothetical protein